ncbi:MAG TPA: hypothetical protein VFY06_00240 [Verrucomicrobiae bacterium]|nr:hypothetical protein [Verrucomicrobiae bacterium]
MRDNPSLSAGMPDRKGLPCQPNSPPCILVVDEVSDSNKSKEMIEENKQKTDNQNRTDANIDKTTETPGVLVAGPKARSRVEKMDPAA